MILNLKWLDPLPLLIAVIFSVAFFTVLERKILASMQRRRGPNIVGIYGLLQAFGDGFKLLAKETIFPSYINFKIFFGAPIITFALSLAAWAFIPLDKHVVISDISLGILFLFAISSLGVYGIILSGWSSNSKYSLIGGLRASAQMISYEVSMALTLMPPLMISGSLSLDSIVYMQQKICYFCFPFFPSCILFFICILAETNRVPFDLPEAESELVSGFNVEYSSVIFTLFFLAEYANILLMSSIWVLVFFGGWLPIISIFGFIPGWFWFIFKVMLVLGLYIWIRATLPRYRFDQLISLGWKVILPLSFGFLLLSILLFFIFQISIYFF